MNEQKILLLSLKDFFTPKMLKFAIVPFIVTLVVMYALFFVVAGMGVEHMATLDMQSTQTSIENGIPHTQSVTTRLQDSEIMTFLMSFALTSWLATFFIYAIGGFLTLYASILVAVFVIGFLTPAIMKELQKRHYSDVEMIGHSNPIISVVLVIKWTLFMLIMFILLIPFYFIPLVNIVAFNAPLYYFFHKVLIFDVSSNLCTDKEEKQIGYFNKNSLRFKTLGLYLISLIPFAIFFGAVFYVIYLANSYFIEVRKIRESN